MFQLKNSCSKTIKQKKSQKSDEIYIYINNRMKPAFNYLMSPDIKSNTNNIDHTQLNVMYVKLFHPNASTSSAFNNTTYISTTSYSM